MKPPVQSTVSMMKFVAGLTHSTDRNLRNASVVILSFS